MQTQYLTAKEVTTELGISFGTLYSYVSRGLIRSEETNGTTRQKRYWAEDVATLRNRRERRRNPTASAATALDFGDPVLESSVTLIEDGKLFYQGHAAIELCTTHSLEQVAELLWNANLPPTAHTFGGSATTLHTALLDLLPTLPAGLTPVERFHALLPLAEAHDLAAHDKSVAGVTRTAMRIYSLLLAAVTGRSLPPDATIARQLAHHWRADASNLTPLIDAALILCADHELNASSFTARCVASTGATPYGAVAAALAALQGPRHGGDTARCVSLITEAQTNPRQTLATWLRRGERLPGFGHRLYPDGDPRGSRLLELAASRLPHAQSILDTVHQLAGEVWETFGLRPNVDLGLATLSLAAPLPAGAPLTLFTTGRIAGWIAHIIEQYRTDELIRPRARYVGPPPQAASATPSAPG